METMRKILFLILTALAFCVGTRAQSAVAAEKVYPEVSLMDSLIVANDTSAIRNICNNIVNLDTTSRNHGLETAYIHSAIDNLNSYAVKIFSDSEIGFYNSELDSISPLEYLYDDNVENRIIKNRSRRIGNMTVAEHFTLIHLMLMVFQPLDYLMLLKAQSRLEGIDDSLFEQESNQED